jgi:hypothetical protein
MPFNPNETDDISQLKALESDPSPEMTTAPAVAAAVAYEIPVFVNGHGGVGTTITRLAIYAAAAITGAATNFQTLQFRQFRAGVLVGLLTGATTYVTTASLATLTEKLLFTGAVVLQPGDLLTLQSVTTGTGAALPIITTVVESSPSV